MIRAVFFGGRGGDFDEIRAFEAEIDQPLGAEFGVGSVVRDVEASFDVLTGGDHEGVAIGFVEFDCALQRIVGNPALHDEDGSAKRPGWREKSGRQCDGADEESGEAREKDEPAFPGGHPNFFSFEQHRDFEPRLMWDVRGRARVNFCARGGAGRRGGRRVVGE